MWYSESIWCGRLFLGLVIIAMLSTVACSGASDKEGTIAMEILNGTPSGDRQHRCYLPVQAVIGAGVAWSRSLADLELSGPPAHLAWADGTLIVRAAGRLVALSAESGALAWSLPAPSAFDLDVQPAGLAIMNQNGEVQTISLAGKREEELLLPVWGGSVRLQQFGKSGDELRYAFVTGPTPVSLPDQDSEPPSLVYQRLALLDGHIRGEVVREDVPVAILATVELVYLVGSWGVEIFAPDVADAGDVTPIEDLPIEAAMIDHEGLLVLAITTDDGRVLRRYDRDRFVGEVDMPPDRLGRQGLAGGPGGRVYCQLDDRLVLLPGDGEGWDYPLPATGEDALFTVLGDGSVLVGVGRQLIHVHAGGVEQSRLELPARITCRPVVDREGRLYVGTTEGVRCYH